MQVKSNVQLPSIYVHMVIIIILNNVCIKDVDPDSGDFEYHLEEDDIVYGNVADIPQNLLLSIIEKYRKMREYCKWCYYRNNEQVIIFNCVFDIKK